MRRGLVIRKPLLRQGMNQQGKRGRQQPQNDTEKEESDKTIVRAGPSISEQSEARDGRATHLLESKSGPPGTRTRNKRFKRPLL